MKKVTGRRFGAYIIDYIIIVFISSLFARITILNPNLEKYNDLYQEYMTSISEKKDLSTTDLTGMSYDLSKAGVNSAIINLVVSTLYFVGFQYINKGKTIGKRLLKIKIVGEGEDKPKFYQVLLHSIIINSLVTSLVSIILIITLSKNDYLTYNQIVQFIDLGLVFLSIGFMIFRKDGKGVHDLLAKTNVVYEE